MKTIIIIIIMAISGSVNAQSLITNEIDEFSGRKVIQSSFEEITYEHRKDAFRFVGEISLSSVSIDGDYIIMISVNSSDGWQILGTRHVRVVVDDERFKFDMRKHTTEVLGGGSIYESHIILVDREFLKKIIKSQDARLRADKHIFTITSKAKEAMRLVYEEANEFYSYE